MEWRSPPWLPRCSRSRPCPQGELAVGQGQRLSDSFAIPRNHLPRTTFGEAPPRTRHADALGVPEQPTGTQPPRPRFGSHPKSCSPLELGRSPLLLLRNRGSPPSDSAYRRRTQLLRLANGTGSERYMG